VERSSGAAPPRQTGGDGEPDLSGARLGVSIERAGTNISVVALSGELDLSTIPLLEQRLLAELRAKRNVVVDLSELSFIDSSGIGLLIQAFRAAGDERAMHTVFTEGSQVDRVFELTGIGAALPLFVDREEAVEALKLR
jgi:anti-sigma B factor antagonist